MNRLFIFIVSLLIVAFFVALPVHAALELQYPNIPGFGVLNDIVKNPIGIAQIVQFVFAAALWISALLAFAALLWSGFIFTTSAGNPGKQREAKDRLAGIALGVLMLISVYMILRTINPELAFLKNGGFAICNDRSGGFIDCKAVPFFESGGGNGGGGQPLEPLFQVCLYDNLLSGVPGTLDPSGSGIRDCQSKVTTSIDYLGAVPPAPAKPGGGTWDDKVYAAILSGNGVFTFYANPFYGGAWIEIKVTNGRLEYCQNQNDALSAEGKNSESCLNALLSDSRNEKNHNAGIPAYFLAFFNHQKGSTPLDKWSSNISSIDLRSGGHTPPPPPPTTEQVGSVQILGYDGESSRHYHDSACTIQADHISYIVGYKEYDPLNIATLVDSQQPYYRRDSETGDCSQAGIEHSLPSVTCAAGYTLGTLESISLSRDDSFSCGGTFIVGDGALCTYYYCKK